MLRGGPSFLSPPSLGMNYNIRSDMRKKFTMMIGGHYNWGRDNSSRMQAYFMNLSYRPMNTLNVSLGPSFNMNKRELQYVDREEFNSENRYIFASIEQKTLNFSIRVNYSIRPNLSIQYWGQPFVSAAKYYDLKRITDPHADNYKDRYHTFVDGNDISYNEVGEYYSIDEDIDGTADYYIENSDFNFKQFRSNLVMRWEYIPGSTLFLVWSQGRTGYIESGEFNFSGDMQDLFEEHPHDIFLIKFSYRFRL